MRMCMRYLLQKLQSLSDGVLKPVFSIDKKKTNAKKYFHYSTLFGTKLSDTVSSTKSASNMSYTDFKAVLYRLQSHTI